MEGARPGQYNWRKKDKWGKQRLRVTVWPSSCSVPWRNIRCLNRHNPNFSEKFWENVLLNGLCTNCCLPWSLLFPCGISSSCGKGVLSHSSRLYLPARTQPTRRPVPKLCGVTSPPSPEMEEWQWERRPYCISVLLNLRLKQTMSLLFWNVFRFTVWYF